MQSTTGLSAGRGRFAFARIEPAQFKTLAALAGPIVLATLLQNTYQLVDAFWLGRLGTRAMASVAVCMPIAAVLIALGGGLAVASSTSVSQLTGRDRLDLVRLTAVQALGLSLIISLAIGLGGAAAAPLALRLLGIGGDLVAAATGFLRVTMLGSVFTFNFAVAQAVLRGRGLATDALCIVAGSVALNAIMAPILIFGWLGAPALGVMGAAWSTLIAQALASALSTALLFHRTRGVGLRFADFRLDLDIAGRLVRIGAPASLEQSISQMNFVMMTVLVTHFGATTLATYGIGIRVLIFAVVPALGISLSTAVLVGQAIGRGSRDAAAAAARLGAAIGFAAGTGEGVLIFAAAPFLAQAFAPNQPILQAQVQAYLRIAAFSYGAMGYNTALAGAYRGAGATSTALALIVAQSWLVQLPTAFLLSRYTPLAQTGIWFSTPAANIVTVAVTTLVFIRARRKGFLSGPD